MTRTRFADERGQVVAVAIVLLAIMLTVGLTAFAFVDSGQKRARNQRERESSLNLAEGVLYAQGFTLAQAWPGSFATQAPTAGCTSAANALLCPNKNLLAAANAASPTTANFANVDELKNVQWTTRVRDNGYPLDSAYDPAHINDAQTGVNPLTGSYTCAAPCTWDANGDHQVWVQARAVVRGRPRNIVAQLKQEQVLESLPQTGVTAGGIAIGNNNDNTIIIDANGSQVIVRCNNAANQNCVYSQPNQISPSPQSSPTAPNLATSAQLARYKARAIADGRYYPGCPTKGADGNYDLSGAIVWVEDCQSSPTFSNNIDTQPCNPAAPSYTTSSGQVKTMAQNCVNQLTTPGMLIWHCGAASFAGSFTYVGILYNVNGSDGTCVNYTPKNQGNGGCKRNADNSPNSNTVIRTTGGFGVWGAIAIDNGGCLDIGDNGLQFYFDPNVFKAASSYGSVGLVQTTWRELPPNAAN